MALNVGELYATLGMDSGSFSKGLSSAQKSLNDLAAKAAKTGAALSLAITAPLVKLGKEAFGAATAFESAFAGVRKTVDATEEQYAKLEKGIIDMSKSIPATAVEISGVAEAAGQLGIEQDSILDFTRVMIDLGESTNMNADDAATTLARFANVTGMAAEDYSRLGSAIVGLGNNFATTESAIAEIAQRMAGTGAVVGMTEADMLGFAAAISSIGMEAQIGGTSISSFASDMAQAVSVGGKDLKKYAKVAGMSAKEFKKLFKEDATGAIQAFIEGLGKAEDPIKVLSDMGLNESGLQRMLLGLANGGDLLANALDTAATEWEKNTALSEEANKRYATMESTLQMVKNNVTELARQIGLALAPYLMKAGEIISRVSTALQNMSPETKDFIVKAGLAAAALGPATAALGGFFKILASGAGVLKFALGPFGLIAGALVAMYKLSPKVRKAFDKMGKFASTFFEGLWNGRKPMTALKTAIQVAFGEKARKTFEVTWKKMGKAWEDTVGWFKDTGEGLQKAWAEGSAQGGFWGSLVESTKYLGGRLGDALKSGWSAVQSAAKTLGVKALSALGIALQGTSFGGLGKKLIEAALALQEGESIDFGGLLTAFKDGIIAWRDETFIPWANSIDWSGLWKTFWETMTNVANWLGTDVAFDVGYLLGKISAGLIGLGGKIANALLDALKPEQGGEITPESFWNAVMGASDWIVKTAEAFFTGLYNGVNGTSFDWAQIEIAMNKGWDEFLKYMQRKGNDAAEAFLNSIKSQINEIFAALGLDEPFIIPVKVEPDPVAGGGRDKGVSATAQTKIPSGGGRGSKPEDFLGSVLPSSDIVGAAASALGLVAEESFAGVFKGGGGNASGVGGGRDGSLVDSALPSSDVIGTAMKAAGQSAREAFDSGFIGGGGTAGGTGGGRKKPDLISELLNNYNPKLKENRETGMQWIKDMFGKIDWSNVDIGLDMGALLEDGLTNQETATAMTALVKAVNSGLVQYQPEIAAAGTNMAAGFTGAITDGESGATSAGSGLVTAAKSGLSAKLSELGLSLLGANFNKGFAGGITSNLSWIIDAAKKAARAAYEAAQKELDEHSPSKVAYKIGAFFSKGMALGIESMDRAVSRASQGVAAIATRGLSYSPARMPSFAGVAGGGSVSVGIDYNRLAAALAAHPTMVNVDSKTLARATVEPNAAAEARRQARIRAGYGG